MERLHLFRVAVENAGVWSWDVMGRTVTSFPNLSLYGCVTWDHSNRITSPWKREAEGPEPKKKEL